MTSVYLIYRNRMFADAVRAVLRTNPNIRLVGATDDADCVLAAIDRFAPDVILLEETSYLLPVHVHAILTNPVPARLVTLCLDRDGMHIWSQQWRASIGPDDLVDAIVSANGHRGRDTSSDLL